ncbi:MAG: hypothetical protein Kow0089_05220 [Desulfobulbaceae bacterium]
MKTLPTIGELFDRTWSEYKKRFLPILAVFLIGTVLLSSVVMAMVLSSTVTGALLVHFVNSGTGIVVAAFLLSLFLLILLLLGFWWYTALLAIVADEELGIIEAFQQGWRLLWPMTWVLTIFSGILCTGFLFGFLPGVLFLVWFGFCPFILLIEDHRGMDSLLVSREYVRGYGWQVFLRLLPLWLVSTLAGLIPFLCTLLSLLLTPFALLYILGIYRDLREIKPVVQPAEGGARIFWWIVTIIGLLLPLALLAWAAFVILQSGGQGWLTMPEWQSPHGLSM